jgi:hypothetical protein
MKIFRADLHVHSVLSPCGDLEMSPTNIIKAAKKKGLDIIGITDHNTTLHCELMKKLGAENDIFVLTGSEVNTKEEVHCLTFFETPELLNDFQKYIDEMLPFIPNKPERFGHQVVVDEYENILKEIESLLFVGINQSIGELRKKVTDLNGIFIPAHVNRQHSGILSQLGFIPKDLNPDAIEIFAPTSIREVLLKYPELAQYNYIKNSDAHQIDRIGAVYSEFFIESISFEEIRKALRGIDGRKIILK